MNRERIDMLDEATQCRFFAVTDGLFWLRTDDVRGLSADGRFYAALLFVERSGAERYLAKILALHPERDWRVVEFVPRVSDIREVSQ